MMRDLALNVKVCDIYDLSEKTFGKKFDVISARMIFHHLPDIKKALGVIKDSLKGKLVLCEGVPPDPTADDFFKVMFRLKEERFDINEREIIKDLYDLGFSEIKSKSIFLEDCSLNNWLDNSGIDQKNIDAIKTLHYNAPPEIKRAYNMRVVGEDLLMTWKFIIITAFTN